MAQSSTVTAPKVNDVISVTVKTAAPTMSTKAVATTVTPVVVPQNNNINYVITTNGVSRTVTDAALTISSKNHLGVAEYVLGQ